MRLRCSLLLPGTRALLGWRSTARHSCPSIRGRHPPCWALCSCFHWSPVCCWVQDPRGAPHGELPPMPRGVGRRAGGCVILPQRSLVVLQAAVSVVLLAGNGTAGAKPGPSGKSAVQLSNRKPRGGASFSLYSPSAPGRVVFRQFNRRPPTHPGQHCSRCEIGFSPRHFETIVTALIRGR